MTQAMISGGSAWHVRWKTETAVIFFVRKPSFTKD